MKVAEFFAELGFKVTGADELKAFETNLQNIAQAAKDAGRPIYAWAEDATYRDQTTTTSTTTTTTA